MSLTLNTTPGEYQLSRNNVWAKISTDNNVSTAGVISVLKIAVSGTSATVGQYVKLPFNAGLITMTFASALDNTGNTLRTAGSLTLANFILQLAADLASNYYISDAYIITSDTSHVILTAKFPGSAYSFISPSTTATGFTFSTNTAGVDQVNRTNFKIILDIYFETSYKSGSFVKIHSQALIPAATSVVFDIHDALHAQLGIDLPSYAMTTVMSVVNCIGRYKIRYAESYGDLPVIQQMTESSICYILKGALSFFENSYTTSILTSYFVASQKFLTWQPRIKTVTTSQQEYLSFMVPSAATTIKLIAKYYYSDGSTSVNTPLTKTSISEYDIYMFPTGYSQIINPVAGKQIIKWDIWIADQTNTVISEIFTYKLILKPEVDQRYFLIENSVGGFDTLRTTGENSTSLSVQTDVGQKILQQGYSPVAAGFQKLLSIGQPTYKQAAGWRTKAEIDWLEELLYSKNVYEDFNGEFVPVIINTASIDKYTSRQTLLPLNFEYSYAFNNLAPRGTIPAPDGGGDEEGGGGGES